MGKSDKETDLINSIGADTIITGNISCKSAIRIAGKFIGNLEVTDKVTINKTGKVNGTILCEDFETSGIVEGKIEVSNMSALKGTAKVEGDIVTKKILIEHGAIFDGTCRMGNYLEYRKEKNKKEKIKGNQEVQ